MPLRFIVVFPFMEFFTLSNSLHRLFIIWSLPCVDCLVYSEASFPLLVTGFLAFLSCLLANEVKWFYLQDRCNTSILHSSSLTLANTSIFHSSSLTLANWLLVPGFIKPSLQDTGVMLKHIPLVLRSFIGRNTIACQIVSHRRHQTDEAGIWPHQYASHQCRWRNSSACWKD